MKCEFDYCVYNNSFTCILKEIEINSFGMCEACELVAVPEGKLEEYKKKRLNDL